MVADALSNVTSAAGTAAAAVVTSLIGASNATTTLASSIFESVASTSTVGRTAAVSSTTTLGAFFLPSLATSSPSSSSTMATAAATAMAALGSSGKANQTNLFHDASLIIANSSNHTGLTEEDFEHFLGDPDVLHALALLLGIGAIMLGKRLPMLLAGVASVSMGLWVGLVVQDRQHFNNPLFGSIDLPKGTWVPWAAGIMAGSAAAGLSYLTWKTALALLTGGLVTLLALASCRLANVSPEKIFKVGSNFLSSYRVVGAVVLTLSVVVCYFAVRKCHEHMADFASAQLGTLLLLSGVSHFSARVGAQAPFSLLDDLARIAAEVRGGNCHLWDDGEVSGKADRRGCDCNEQCRTEIAAWMASSATVLISRVYIRWRRKRKDQASAEERAPLADEQDPSPSATPGAQVVGASRA